MEKADSTSKTLWIFLWVLSLAVVGGLSYYLGAGAKSKDLSTSETVTVTPIALQPTQTPITPTVAVDLESSCSITGPSQKKDYLVTYLLKEGDSFAKIAENELGDSTRVSEITKLNEEQRNLTVGSTIYLPPSDIKQSSGNIVEVSGKIVKKDAASWQLTYGGGEKGLGIWLPGFWFKDFADVNSYKVGDCVTILFDNGVKVYSVKKALN